MNRLGLETIRIATGATPINAGHLVMVHSICTDSRKIEPGCLFIALRGENHDGHDHVAAAAAKGAIAAMVDRPVAADLPLIQVDDTRQAMGRLANHIRRQMKCTVIAVAGSNGKTGTKNLIHSVLKASLRGTISPRSFNNDVGVPTTIFAADPLADYLVLEIGTNHPGEILQLTKIAEPDIAVITNIGAEHLEFFGDLDGVTHENAQIIAGLNPAGLLVVNGDFPALLRATESYPGERITFGFESCNDLHACDIQCRADGIHFRLGEGTEAPTQPKQIHHQRQIHHGGTESTEREPSRSAGLLLPSALRALRASVVNNPLPKPTDRGIPTREPDPDIFIPLMGRHTAVNALAAIAVARHLNIDDAAIFKGLASATGPEMRLQMQTAGSVRILNDAYNANPHSMRAGLQTLRDMETAGRRIAILGDMRELGATADRYHAQVGQFAAGCDLDQLVCVGEKAALIARAAIDAGMSADCVEHYPTVADCAVRIAEIVGQGDLVLLKASRGMKLEALGSAITTASARSALRRVVKTRTRQMIPPAPARDTIAG